MWPPQFARGLADKRFIQAPNLDKPTIQPTTEASLSSQGLCCVGKTASPERNTDRFMQQHAGNGPSHGVQVAEILTSQFRLKPAEDLVVKMPTITHRNTRTTCSSLFGSISEFQLANPCQSVSKLHLDIQICQMLKVYIHECERYDKLKAWTFR